MEPILTVRELRFRYETYEPDEPEQANQVNGESAQAPPDKPAEFVLDGLDMTVSSGEFVAVVGHNGSGKSTLARHFNALLLPTGGQVLVRDIDTRDEDRVYDIRRTVGLVLQNPDNQMVSTIVEEDVAFGPENLGLPPMEIRRRVDDALEIVGMSAYRDHAPHKLSGGQKQRVAIAGILAMQPDCLVLDESTAMLDPAGRHEVLDTIRTLREKQGITVILITHYMDEAAMADRVVVMDNGHIIMEGSPREIFSRPDELRIAQLDIPQPSELCERLRENGIAVPRGILTASECAGVLADLLPKSPDSVFRTITPAPAEAGGEPVISARGLCYTYMEGTPFRKDAMEDVSFDIYPGEFIGIIGHTGSGKSTLVQHLNGLMRPGKGQVLLGGKDIWDSELKIRDVRFEVGLVFQYPEHQLFENTVYKDIAFGPKNMGLDADEIDRRVRDAARAVQLRDELLYASPFDLSGGEKRRAAIAGVLAMRPRVLILDEPTAGLDPRGRDTVLDIVEAYRRESGTAVILVSHNMEDVARVSDRVLVMNRGRAVMFAGTEEVFSRAGELSDMGLAVPAVSRIFMELSAMGCTVGAPVYTVKSAAERLIPLMKGVAPDA